MSIYTKKKTKGRNYKVASYTELVKFVVSPKQISWACGVRKSEIANQKNPNHGNRLTMTLAEFYVEVPQKGFEKNPDKLKAAIKSAEQKAESYVLGTEVNKYINPQNGDIGLKITPVYQKFNRRYSLTK